MKYIDLENPEQMPEGYIEENQPFAFDCHPNVSCFNRCCRNLKFFLYPYDLVRLKQHLGITSDAFLENYVDIVLRPGNHFPEVLLRMRENEEKTCMFLGENGCSVYPDRPDTCRNFPLEQGLLFNRKGKHDVRYFLKVPEFCRGVDEKKEWTPRTWIRTKEKTYQNMTIKWAEIKDLFLTDPWGKEGHSGPSAKMAFMAAYNMESFRSFIFESSFLKRYKIKSALLQKIAKDDAELLKVGFDWIKLYLFQIPSKKILPRR